MVAPSFQGNESNLHPTAFYLVAVLCSGLSFLTPLEWKREECIERRSVNVAMLICMMFVEMEVDIPQHVWEDPALETVRSSICHMVFLDNVSLSRSVVFPTHTRFSRTCSHTTKSRLEEIITIACAL